MDHIDIGCSLFIVHGILHGDVIPLIYTLIPNQTLMSYIRALEGARDLCQTLSTEQIFIDYDIIILEAVRHVFGPDLHLKGTRLSFTKRIDDIISANRSFHKIYYDSTNIKFNIKVRHLDALSFVPPHEVTEVYKNLLETQFFIENRQLLDPLIHYFDEMFIGNNVDAPAFPISSWNCYSDELNFTTHVNNAIESWYRTFYAAVNVQVSSLETLLDLLQIDQHSGEIYVNDIISNSKITTKYTDFDIRLIEIEQRWKEIDNHNRSLKLDYLNDVALHLSTQSE